MKGGWGTFDHEHKLCENLKNLKQSGPPRETFHNVALSGQSGSPFGAFNQCGY